MLRKCKKKSSDPPFVWKLEGAGQWEHFHCPAPSHRFRRRSNSLNFCSSESPVNLLFHIGRTISHDLKIRRILGSKTERLHFLGRFRPSHCPAPSHPTPIRSITLIFYPSDSPKNLLFSTGKTNLLHLKILTKHSKISLDLVAILPFSLPGTLSSDPHMLNHSDFLLIR